MTEEAVRAFQTARGLRCDGRCDENTWTALVEASWKLGDRALFLTSPNLRGDDVAELQTRLGRIGFDCGRVDGILGPRTAVALEEFQSNCGTTSDGVCGPETVRTLDGDELAIRNRARVSPLFVSGSTCAPASDPWPAVASWSGSSAASAPSPGRCRANCGCAAQR